MYRIEIENTDGSTMLFGEAKFGEAMTWDSLELADSRAEDCWLRLSGDERYSRFSVVDSDGNRLTDWEC
jgi:hypothetical protein